MASPPLPFDLAPENDEPDASANPRQDVDEAIRLLRWARASGWDIPELRVGGVVMRVRDLKPTYGKVEAPTQPTEQRRGIWDEFAPPVEGDS